MAEKKNGRASRVELQSVYYLIGKLLIAALTLIESASNAGNNRLKWQYRCDSPPEVFTTAVTNDATHETEELYTILEGESSEEKAVVGLHQ